MKDPAVLFYTNDFLAGTFTMTNEQVGKYIRLLCLQHQKGTLTANDMLNICQTYDVDIYSHFIKDGDNYYNPRMRKETERRKLYSESRKNNRKSKDYEEQGKTYDNHMPNISKTYVPHMETETITETETVNEAENEKKEYFEMQFIQKISDEHLPIWREWIDYCYARGDVKLNRQTVVYMINLLKENSGRINEIIILTMQKNAKGLIANGNNTKEIKPRGSIDWDKYANEREQSKPRSSGVVPGIPDE
jgi:hypothetical protein